MIRKTEGFTAKELAAFACTLASQANMMGLMSEKACLLLVDEMDQLLGVEKHAHESMLEKIQPMLCEEETEWE